MHPILVELSDTRAIGTYGLMVALGVLVTGGLVARASWRAGLDVGRTIAALACTLAGGFSGAWLAFAVVELARTGALDAVRTGGLVFYGSIPGGLAAAWLAARLLSLDLVRLLDLGAPAMAAGHALGRMGCFLGGCCYGRPFDGAWAVLYTHPLSPAAHPPVNRHPAPLYEAAGLLALAFAFALRPPARPGDGSRALLYLALYCVLRLATELARGDAVRGLWVNDGVSTAQLLSLLGLALAAAVVAARRRQTG